ncbi:MAG: S-methyl-5'-thioadenosine phosphorylase [Chloroflexi bacterium]|nr:S-methyl-5'-thioadenosine phosphorylase [Chloroflexota bacterium]
MSKHPTIGVIGGSGLYSMDGLEDIETHNIKTPFGDPSSPITVGALEGQRLAFLARHGVGHFITPTEVNYRANIYALKSLGVERVLSVSACGSFREDYAPGNLVVPDQLFDFTRDRKRSFFEKGFVAHVGVADPFCANFSRQIYKAVESSDVNVHMGGTFITIEGPRFSTRGESNIFRNWGLDIIGMTTSPEAYLAREAELCYGVLAHVTDYDVWHTSEEPVTAEMVFKTLSQSIKTVQMVVKNLAQNLDINRNCDCAHALSAAMATDPRKIPGETRDKLSLLVNKYLPK